MVVDPILPVAFSVVHLKSPLYIRAFSSNGDGSLQHIFSGYHDCVDLPF